MPASFPPPAANLFNGVTTQAAAMTALGLTASNAFGLVVGNPTGGNKGVGTINATGLFVNGTAVGSTSTAAITSGTIDGASIGATAPAVGTFSTLGFTGTLKFSGSTILAVAANQNMYVGINAGIANTTGGLNTFVGNGAGQSNTTGGENTFIGTIAGVFITTGTFNTAVGEHSLGFETVSSSNTAVGNDCMRNWVSPISQGGNTAIGKSAMALGGGFQSTAVGFGAMVGNSSALVISGTPTANETISLVFTWSTTQFVNPSNSPHTVSYPVGATPTLANIAAGLLAAINADVTLFPFSTGAGICSAVVDNNNLTFTFPGTSVTGAALAITASTTGTTVLTVNGGPSGANNIAIGFTAMNGYYMTTANDNIAVGTSTLQFLTTGFGNFAALGSSGQQITTGSNNILIGAFSGQQLTTASGSIAIGNLALSNVAVGGNNVAIGQAAMRFYNGVFGGSNQSSVAIGANSLTGTAASSHFQNVAVGGNTGAVISTGSSNVLLGSTVGQVLTTGSNNTLLGFGVGSTTLTTGIANIYIGNSTAIDAATAGESHVFRIGGNATNLMRATGINTATPAFFLDWLPASTSYATDTTAAAGGIAVGQLYRNGSIVQCRIT